LARVVERFICLRSSGVYGEVRHQGYVFAYKARREIAMQLLTEVLSPGSRILRDGSTPARSAPAPAWPTQCSRRRREIPLQPH
jgi:hypothetical protein